MIYFQGTTDFYMAGPCAVTLGKFDGVHLGHQKLFNEVKKIKPVGGSSVAFVFSANQQALLLTNDEQKRAVEDMGIDALVRCPFVPEISGMSPDDFIQKILIEKLHATHVVVGADFRFGHDRLGDAQFLLDHQEKYHLKVCVIEKEKLEGRDISSTYMREALGKGDMELVAALMGRPYPVHGIIIHGRHLGTSLGMPTCNLVPRSEKLLPPDGVYFSRSTIEGSVYNSITNIGYKPTVDGSFRGVETYLYDCNEDLYGKEMQVELLHFCRPERRFSSKEQLAAQVHADMNSGRAYFGLGSNWEEIEKEA